MEKLIDLSFESDLDAEFIEKKKIMSETIT